ncbi:hypothetical protein [Botrimarina hoheduenensis]|uniref:PEP-CTERM protein-sorting domain-containing protein n=1 Tax=Botrimarina hoheduenensis TaxID=2528000 RepID=A0A5C5WA46_9BACT|nr:hypothetical protein [Botrimarina hoheduenensis]TWT47746.1 hypothetical protein Pla111_13660 [Botrimarina hoheduenensis]
MKTFLSCCGLLVGCTLSTSSALAVTNLAVNPGFEDLDLNTELGDGWGQFFNAGFNNFFGANGHASLFGDIAGNSGGVFQLGIPGVAGQRYQFDLLNTRIESAWDADLYLGVEYYAADDTTQLGVDEMVMNTAERINNGTIDGNIFSFQGGPAPVGTSIVRPVVRFDNVNATYLGQSQANLFVFDTYFSEVPVEGGNLLKNPAFDDDYNGTNLPGVLQSGDNWGTFGSAGAVQFNDLFGGNPHVSFFADTAGNNGGLFQQSLLAQAGEEYRFTLEDVRLEQNFDADFNFGLEFFASDDFTKVGESIVAVDTSTTGDGLTFSMTSTAPVGAVYVRPLITFDNVNAAYLGQSQASAFIFSTSLAVAVETAVDGDFNGDGRVDNGDLNLLLGSWGSTTVPAAWINGFVSPVDNAELNALLGNWGFGTAVAIPEPAAGLLLMAGLLATGGRRRA